MGTDMLIVLIVWLIGAIVTYFLINKDAKFKEEPKWVLSAIWPVTLVAWIVSKL